MGATVSREHAKLPFGYTHARKEDYICTTSLSLLSSTVTGGGGGPVPRRRQSLANRLLSVRNADSTAVTPLRLPDRLQLTEDGIVPGSTPGSLPAGALLSFMPHSGVNDTDSDDGEIVSLSSILNQGPEFEPQWHPVGQDQDEGLYNYTSINTSTSTSTNTNGNTTADRIGAPFPLDTDSGHESGCVAHSRSSTLESIAHSVRSHHKSDRETTVDPYCRSGTGSPSTCAAPGAVALAIAVGPYASMEVVSDPFPETSECTTTDVTVATMATNASHITTALSLSNGADQDVAKSKTRRTELDTSSKLSPTPTRPHIHPCQHLQKHSFKALQQDLVDTDEEEEGSTEELDDEENRSKSDRRKMDILSALGIADVPNEGPEDVPFNFFKDEPIFHSLPDQYRLQMTRRNTMDWGSYSRSKGVGPWGDYDDYAATVHLPQDFFEGHRRRFGIADEDDSDEESELDGDEGDQTVHPRIRKRISGGYSLLNYSMAMAADEDVAHLSPIPFSELPSVTNIGLCSHGIVKLSSNIRLLSSATCLQICCNDLCSVPTEIGFLRNLTLLDLSKNSLTILPDSIQHLTKLVELKLSFNFLESLPTNIGALSKLTSLHLDSNRLSWLPASIGQIKGLLTLDLSDNPISVLPAGIGHLPHLRRLRLDRCPLVREFVHSPLHSPPTLLELAARVMVRHRIQTPPLLPPHLKAYLKTAQQCSFCHGPYFESSVRRGKIMEKNDVYIPLEYTLCMPHWNTELERVKLLFGPKPVTAPPSPSPPTRPTSPAIVQKLASASSGTSSPGASFNASVRRASTSPSIFQRYSSSSPQPPTTNLASSSNPGTSMTIPAGTATPPPPGPPTPPPLLQSADLNSDPPTGNNSRVRSFRIRSSSRNRAQGPSSSPSSSTSSSQPASRTDPTGSIGNASTPPTTPMILPSLQQSSSSSSAIKSRFSIRLKARTTERPSILSP